MAPVPGPPRTDGRPVQTYSDGGLVELIDQGLVRLDSLRDRPRFSSAMTALLVFLLAVGWTLARWRSVEPIDDRIPRIDELAVVDEPIDGESAAGAGGRQPTTSIAPGTAGPSTSIEPEERLIVHVSGAVMVEGLVEVMSGSRLADAVTAAGGPTGSADLHRLNLATPLVDGMHIRVPEMGEEPTGARPLIETAPAGSSADPEADTVPPGGVNINQASATELQRLPGIGPAIAAAIITWRIDNGPFTSTDDLLDVPGIGPAKLAAIEDQVSL